MKRLSKFMMLVFGAGILFSSCSNNKSAITGYEWLEGDWYGNNAERVVYGDPDWARVIITKNDFKAGTSNYMESTEEISKIEAAPIVLAEKEYPLIESTGLSFGADDFFIDEANKRIVAILGEFEQIELTKAGDDNAEKTGDESTEQVPAVNDNRVYSCAYDGYTNIRETASSKATVLGKLKNGPEGAEFIGVEGDWTKIGLDGLEGYVLSKYITDQPTKPVTTTVTADWLEGIWSDCDYEYYLIFNNGYYAIYNINFCEGAFTQQGKWMLEEDNINLTITDDFVNEGSDENYVGYCSTFKIDPAGKIRDMKKVKFTSEEEYDRIYREAEEEGASIDRFLMSKSHFNNLKKSISIK